MTWTTYRSRGEILREALNATESRRDGALPMDVPGVDERFRDELDLLAAMMLRWHARLSGNLEQAFSAHLLGEQAIVSAWAETARQLPGLRAVIDHYTENPTDDAMAQALERATRKEWMRLAIGAGLAGAETPEAARAGQLLMQAARDQVATGRPAPRLTRTMPARPERARPSAAGSAEATKTMPAVEADQSRAGTLPRPALAGEPASRPGGGRSLADRIRAALAA